MEILLLIVGLLCGIVVGIALTFNRKVAYWIYKWQHRNDPPKPPNETKQVVLNGGPANGKTITVDVDTKSIRIPMIRNREAVAQWTPEGGPKPLVAIEFDSVIYGPNVIRNGEGLEVWGEPIASPKSSTAP